MDFIQFLLNKHLLTNKGKAIKDISALQYNSRLNSMIEKKIYNKEMTLNNEIVRKINASYTNAANEYERTLKYYIEYQMYIKKQVNG